MPLRPSRPSPLWPLGSPVGIAHRGAHEHAAENSLAAFEAAAALGYRVVETDVRASADGVAVLSHDPDLLRTTGVPARIAELPWDALAALPAPAVPARLDEALTRFPTLTFNLDVKVGRAVAPVAAAVLAAGAVHRVCIASFSDARRRAVLAALAAAGAGVPASSAGRAGMVRFLAAARAGVRGRALRAVVGASCLQVPVRHGRVPVITAASLAAARSAGLPVHAWTIDDVEQVRRLLDAGVDGVITDAPRVLAAVLAERGTWPSVLAGGPGATPPAAR